MNFMSCGSCSRVCEINNTGICLGCQRGFVNLPQEDSWEKSPHRKKVKLEQRQKELEDAIQESSAKEVSLRKKAGSGQGVRTPHSQRKKVAKKG